jgi:hypothetical protein
VSALVRVIQEMERETRIELATNRMEACDSTIELLPLLFVFNKLKCMTMFAVGPNWMRYRRGYVEPLHSSVDAASARHEE